MSRGQVVAGYLVFAVLVVLLGVVGEEDRRVAEMTRAWPVVVAGAD